MAHELELTLQLGAAAVVALWAVYMIVREHGRVVPHRSGVVAGYPSRLFAAQQHVRAGALAELAGTQARLLALYDQVPAHSDLAAWLQMFLVEFRPVMDSAYRVAVHSPDQAGQLDRLAAEVRQVEAQIAELILGRLAAREDAPHQERLAGRLEALRLCARELLRFDVQARAT